MWQRQKKETQCNVQYRANVVEVLPGENFYQEQDKQSDFLACVERQSHFMSLGFF